MGRHIFKHIAAYFLFNSILMEKKVEFSLFIVHILDIGAVVRRTLVADATISLGITGSRDDNGIKAALLCSDGEIIVEKYGSLYLPYSNDLKTKISTAKIEMFKLYNHSNGPPYNKAKLLSRLVVHPSKKKLIDELSMEITQWCVQVAKRILQRTDKKADIIGFNGHPLLLKEGTKDSAPMAYNLGLPSILAEETKAITVFDFHDADIELGGRGVPLVPIFYNSLFRYAACRGFIEEKQTVAIVSLDEMANVTVLNSFGAIESFCAGPGNVLVKEYVQRVFQRSNDSLGILANKGDIIEKIVNMWIEDKILPLKVHNKIKIQQANIERKTRSKKPKKKKATKSGWETYWLNKFDVSAENCQNAEGDEAWQKEDLTFRDFLDCLELASRVLTPVDCVATLSAFTAQAVSFVLNKRYGNLIRTIVLTGSERKNVFIKTALSKSYNVVVSDDISWDENFMEAEQYALYAVRSLFMFPTTFPSTTGVSKPALAGKLTIPISFCNGQKSNTAKQHHERERRSAWVAAKK